MLVLSRRIGQEVCIGNDTVISVQQIQGGRVVLGFVAPDSVKILRSELTDRFCPDCLENWIDCRCSQADAKRD